MRSSGEEAWLCREAPVDPVLDLLPIPGGSAYTYGDIGDGGDAPTGLLEPAGVSAEEAEAAAPLFGPGEEAARRPRGALILTEEAEDEAGGGKVVAASPGGEARRRPSGGAASKGQGQRLVAIREHDLPLGSASAAPGGDGGRGYQQLARLEGQARPLSFRSLHAAVAAARDGDRIVLLR